jgi:crotonobetainyl-CoA:carnitine CoA-transferase CaiB-like acyl-CoA transferase
MDLSANRGKRSIALDLKNPQGRALLARLAARCDVLLENFRPGVAARLGVGYEAVRAANPKVLYASISAFGQRGPARDLPGSDTVAQAFSGMMAVNRDAAGVPKSTGFLTADYVTALYAFQALAAALAAQPHEAEGRHLDVSLMQASAAFLAAKIIEERFEGGPAPKLNAPAGSYRTGDGWIAITLTKEAHFAALCAAIGRPALAADARFADFSLRSRNLGELAPLVQEALLSKTTAGWLAVFRAADVLASRIHDPTSWLGDPQVQAMGVVSEVQLPGLPPIPWVRIPGLPAPTQGDPRAAWPQVGEHSDAILREALGLTDKEIDALRSGGALS